MFCRRAVFSMRLSFPRPGGEHDALVVLVPVTLSSCWSMILPAGRDLSKWAGAKDGWMVVRVPVFHESAKSGVRCNCDGAAPQLTLL